MILTVKILKDSRRKKFNFVRQHTPLRKKDKENNLFAVNFTNASFLLILETI
jgi:hypothetical protein